MLSEKEKEFIIELIQCGKPIPSIYLHKLFQTEESQFLEVTKDYKLYYKDKARKEGIITQTPTAPLQKIRTFNCDNMVDDDWENMIIFGDNLMALKTLYEDQRGANIYNTKNRIKLIYIDPPFATKKDFMKDREKAYRDKIIGAQFIEFLRKRLILLREVLADQGSIYVHLDQKKGHYLKVILDEVFGEHNFVNEIIWQKVRVSKSQSSNYGNIHDVIYFYRKNEDIKFETQYVGLSEKYIKSHYSNIEPETNRRYQLCDLTQSGSGPARMFGEKGEIEPPLGKHWIYTQKNIDKYLDRIVFTSGNMPRIKRYLDESKGIPVTDIWTDIYPINSQASEKVDYPTQKPEKLLERIISASSEEGDIILDAFAGSGTSLAVAEKLNRRWIGMDCGKLAIYTIQKRILNLTSHIGSVNKDGSTEFERVSDLHSHPKNSRGMFFVFQKARKGDLNITDNFIKNLADLISQNLAGNDEQEFSLACPEEKLKLNELELSDDEDANAGEKVITLGNVRFLISFIQEKEKAEKVQPLKAKKFTLFNAGIYDNRMILDLSWEHYKPFVANLFGLRLESHNIFGFKADGYIGIHSAYIWDYPNQKNLILDNDFVSTLHSVLGGRAGSKFFIIAPIVAMGFIEDEIEIDDTTYVFLKIPLSILMALIEQGIPGSLKQPLCEDDVNEVIDAVGFDFISQPEVIAAYKRKPAKNLEEMDYIIEITQFKSNTLIYDPDDFENFETLSMILVDTDYNGEYFDLKKAFWGQEILNKDKTQAIFGISNEEFKGDKMMLIFMDMYGNELKVVKSESDFE